MKDRKMAFWTTPPNFMLVAELKGVVVGLVAIQRQSANVAELNRLSAAPNTRGHGIGRALVEEAISRSRHLGFGSIYLSTGEVRQDAIRLYQRLGFKLVGQNPGDVKLVFSMPSYFHGIVMNEYSFKIKNCDRIK